MSLPSDMPDETTAGRLRAELGFLSELSVVVASNTELNPILEWIVNKTTAMLRADEGSIKLLGDSEEASAKTIVRKPAAGIESGSWPMPISTSVMGFLLYKGEALATPDIREDARFPGLKKVETRMRAVLAVPLRVENRVTGMIAVTTLEPGRQWTEDDIQLLSIVAANSAGVLEQARLRVEAEEKKRLEEEKERMERELNLARDIQMGLVPAKPLVSSPWEVHGRVIPARQVGGDYFDYYALDNGSFSICIADVSGKGVPAALLVSNVQASLRAFCDGTRDLPSAMQQINHSVARAGSSGKFVTLFYGEVHPQEGKLRYVNAGHNYPLLRRSDGTIETLGAGGLILGIFEGAEYEMGEVTFNPPDKLLLFSDGISEAEDRTGDQYGDDRLEELWGQCGGKATNEIISCLFHSVEEFRGDAAQSDDMTVVVVGPQD